MASVLENRWARLAIPSLSDLFLLAILVWLFVSGGGMGWSGLLADADIGWHIRTGETILDTGRAPYVDPYSFSKPGETWFAWEWLADVIYGGLHRLAGLKGVVLAAALMLSVFATTLVRRMVWRDTHVFVAMVVALLGVGCSTIHFLARPHVFTLLLLSAAMWLIEADRRSPSRRIWWLAPLTVVWTNLHGGFLALIAVLGLTAVGAAAEAWLGGGRTVSDALRWAKLTAVCGLATLVNPYGWNLHVHVAGYLQSSWIRNMIQEFQSPSFRSESMLQFEALLLAGVLAAAGMFRRKQVAEGLWILFWAHMALGSVRHVPVFVTVCAPVIAAELAAWWRAWTGTARRSSLAGIVNAMAADSLAGFRRTSAWPWAVAVGLMAVGAPLQWPRDFPKQLFPVQMVSEHGELLARSRVLTTDQWGDYLIYRNPLQKVFVDGRSDFYGEQVGREYVELLNGHWRWRQWMEKYGFDVALVPVSNAIAELLKREPGWRVVADDGQQILLVRQARAVQAAGSSPVEPGF
jgi:type IV secretory pathway VirB2 component (pilin)